MRILRRTCAAQEHLLRIRLFFANRYAYRECIIQYSATLFVGEACTFMLSTVS